MADLKNVIQSADWKTEKHVPVIDGPDQTKAGEPIQVTVSVGKEVAHPNTTAHHISWIALFFLPEGAKFPFEIAKVELASHGAGTEGADTSTVYTHPYASVSFKTEKPG